MKIIKTGFIAKVGGDISAHRKIKNYGCCFISEEELKTDNDYVPTIYESERGAWSAIRYQCQGLHDFNDKLFATGEVIPVTVNIEIEVRQ